MNCESCEVDHDGSYGSGRFCSSKCARGYSTKIKRAEINEKVSLVLSGKPSPLKGKPGRKLTEEQREKMLSGIKRYNEERRKKTSSSRKKSLVVARVMAYRARKKKAIMPDSDLNIIRLIYENCPPGYHVDHIQALARGGAHHQDNLQYLPVSENCRKCADREYDKSKAIDWRTIVKLE